MRKMAYIILFFLIFSGSAQAEDKEIYFWLDKQMGAAYENGQLIYSFWIISGYDGLSTTFDGRRTMHKPTPKGTFGIRWKHAKHVNHEGVPMPYSMFFYGRCAIHAWSWEEPLPAPGHGYASHGCISVNLSVAQWLFNWAPVGTVVYIWGERK